MKEKIAFLEEKARWVWAETLKAHARVPESRIASSLSPIEIFVVLYYGKIIHATPKNPFDELRDRLIVSKGHGGIALYPILSDMGFFPFEKLEKFGSAESFLTAIPDVGIPGIETINGSLGHGLGVACGIALALKEKRIKRKVYVLCGDGEMNEGAIWEAVMFAAFNKLGNMVLIIDDNNRSMLGNQSEILGLHPLEQKFIAFGWKAARVDGHDIKKLYQVMLQFGQGEDAFPRVVVAETKKGKDIPELEKDPLCHVKSLSKKRVEEILEKYDAKNKI
jgi:transketolase